MKINGRMGSPSPEMLKHLMQEPKRKPDGSCDDCFWEELFALFALEIVRMARFLTFPNLRETIMKGNQGETIPCDIKIKLPRGLFMLGCRLSSPDEFQLRQLSGITDEGKWIFGMVKATGIKCKPRILAVNYTENQPTYIASRFVCKHQQLPGITPRSFWFDLGDELSYIVHTKRAALDFAEDMYVQHRMVSGILSVLKA